MDVLTFIFSAENVRTVILFITVVYGISWLKLNFEKTIDEKLDKRFGEQEKTIDKRFDEQEKRFSDIDKRFDEMEKRFNATLDERFNLLKINDFAHLNRTIKALTFTLEKNNVLNPEDKKYIDSHLDEK